MTWPPAGGVAHWDDVPVARREIGDMCAGWRDLGRAAGSTVAGLQRVTIDPGCRPGPVHVHGAEEEIFYVLGGEGLAWLDGAVHHVGPSDVVVCLADGPEHTLIAGDRGLEVLAFGENRDVPLVRMPRAGVLRRSGFVAELATGRTALEREAAAGPLELPAPTARPSCIVAVRDVEAVEEGRGDCVGLERNLGAAAGSVRTGLRHDEIPPERLSCPPHHHSGEHELFVLLEGDGTLLLHDQRGEVTDETPLRAGSIVSRPAGTGVAHAMRAGSAGMTYLAYGTREPNEIVYYPRSRKAFLGATLVHLDLADDYWEGEV